MCVEARPAVPDALSCVGSSSRPRVAARQQTRDLCVSSDLAKPGGIWFSLRICVKGVLHVSVASQVFHELPTLLREDYTDFALSETTDALVLKIILESQLSQFKHTRC